MACRTRRVSTRRKPGPKRVRVKGHWRSRPKRGRCR